MQIQHFNSFFIDLFEILMNFQINFVAIFRY
jgi:hypothetical protein